MMQGLGGGAAPGSGEPPASMESLLQVCHQLSFSFDLNFLPVQCKLQPSYHSNFVVMIVFWQTL